MTRNDPRSKTRKKQEMHALQEAGTRLIRLPEDRLRQLDLPDELRHAIGEAKRITAHGGLRRQERYIGKLMRGVDMECLARQLDDLTGAAREDSRLLHAAEDWRERLLAEGGALDDLLRQYPAADPQPLRALIRNIRNAPADGSSRERRTLFRLLRALLQPAADEDDVDALE